LYFRDNFPEETARGHYWDSLLMDMKVVLKKHRLFELEDLPSRTQSWFKLRKAGEVPERSPWPSAVLGLPG
jgi:hypothetical protein